MGLQNLWRGGTIKWCFLRWLTRVHLKLFEIVPFLVIWGTWTTRNSSLFQEKNISSFQVATQVNVLSFAYKPIPSNNLKRFVGEVQLNKSYDLGFFDGAFQGPSNISSFILVLSCSYSCYVQVKENLCRSKNKLVELKDILFLLK